MKNSDYIWRETFNNIGTNAAAIAATEHIVIENRNTAEKDRNLPHNAFVIANRSTTCTLYLFLDNFNDQDKPDYVLFPSQQIAVDVEEGVTFSHIFIKNTHAANDVAINELKYKISTLKRVRSSPGV